MCVASVAAITVATCLRPQTATLWLADAWSLVSPKPLQATNENRLNGPVTTSDRERTLLAECLRLRRELSLLRPTAVHSDRLVHVNAVPAQVLWTTREERDAFVSLFDPTNSDIGSLVVADSAIDVGALTAVEPDGLVLAGRRLIGRVENVGLRSCAVMPTTSDEFQIPVEIVRRTTATPFVGAVGTYRGDGDQAGVLEFIPADAAVSIGDEVFTAAGSLWSAERLHVGTISSAELLAGEPHWRIVVTPSGVLRPRDPVLVLRPRIDSEVLQRSDAANRETIR